MRGTSTLAVVSLDLILGQAAECRVDARPGRSGQYEQPSSMTAPQGLPCIAQVWRPTSFEDTEGYSVHGVSGGRTLNLRRMSAATNVGTAMTIARLVRAMPAARSNPAAAGPSALPTLPTPITSPVPLTRM